MRYFCCLFVCFLCIFQISSARVVKTINAHTDVLHLVLRPSLTSSANSGNSSNSSSNSSNTWFPSHAGSGGGSSVAGAAAASAVHASPYMGGSESAGRSMVAQKATRVTQVTLLNWGLFRLFLQVSCIFVSVLYLYFVFFYISYLPIFFLFLPSFHPSFL